MRIEDLGRMQYREAWARQEAEHERVLAGGEECVLVVEHPPVITFGRRPGVEKNLLASPDQLDQLGVEVVQSDRGGDITYHGPGQLVAYPIVRLSDHGLSVSGYVHGLERLVIETLADFGVPAHADPSAVGVWADDVGAPAKVCAIGVRIRRGVSLHGLALNVAPDLSHFELIVPCGLTGRPVTSLRKLLGDAAPPFPVVRDTLSRHLFRAFGAPPSAARQLQPVPPET